MRAELRYYDRVKIVFLLQSNEVRNNAWMDHEGLVRAGQVLTNSALSTRHSRTLAGLKAIYAIKPITLTYGMCEKVPA